MKVKKYVISVLTLFLSLSVCKDYRRYGEVLIDISNEGLVLPGRVIGSNTTQDLKEVLMIANFVTYNYMGKITPSFSYYVYSDSSVFSCGTLLELLELFRTKGVCLKSEHTRRKKLFGVSIAQQVNICKTKEKFKNVKKYSSLNALSTNIMNGIVVLYKLSKESENTCLSENKKILIEKSRVSYRCNHDDLIYEHVVVVKMTRTWFLNDIFRYRIEYINFKNEVGTDDFLVNINNDKVMWKPDAFEPTYYLIN